HRHAGGGGLHEAHRMQRVHENVRPEMPVGEPQALQDLRQVQAAAETQPPAARGDRAHAAPSLSSSTSPVSRMLASENGSRYRQPRSRSWSYRNRGSVQLMGSMNQHPA